MTSEFDQVLDVARLHDEQNHRGPLTGVVFAVEATADVLFGSIIGELEKQGGLCWGRTESSESSESLRLPETNLRNPHHPWIQIGGSSGGSAVSVACGNSQFSVGTNGGGSNRTSAGLLGLSGMVFGTAPHSSEHKHSPSALGLIAKTPHELALICGSILPLGDNESVSQRLSDIRSDLRSPYEPGAEPRIGTLLEEAASPNQNCHKPYQ